MASSRVPSGHSRDQHHHETGEQDSKDTSHADWLRGQIIAIPLVEPFLEPRVKNERSSTRSTGYGESQVRSVVIVQIYASHMVCLPILDGEKDAEYDPILDIGNRAFEAARKQRSIMWLRAASFKVYDPSPLPDPTEKCLYVSDDWTPPTSAYIELNRPITVEYHWPLRYLEQLDVDSSALCQQRYRVCFNTGFAPVKWQPSIFRQQAAREPLPPIERSSLLCEDVIYGHKVYLPLSREKILPSVQTDGDFIAKSVDENSIFINDHLAEAGMPINTAPEWSSNYELIRGTPKKSRRLAAGKTVKGLRRSSDGQLEWHVRAESISINLDRPGNGYTLDMFRPAHGRNIASSSRTSNQVSPTTTDRYQGVSRTIRASPVRQSILVALPPDRTTVKTIDVEDTCSSEIDRIQEMKDFEKIASFRDDIEAGSRPRPKILAQHSEEVLISLYTKQAALDLVTDNSELLSSSGSSGGADIIVELEPPPAGQTRDHDLRDWSEGSESSLPPPTIAMPVTQTKCKHRCKNKRRCGHRCCKIGLPPRSHVAVELDASQQETVRRMQESFSYARAHRTEVGELLGRSGQALNIILGSPSPPILRLRMNSALAKERFKVRKPDRRHSTGSKNVLKLGKAGRKKHFSG